MFKTFLVIFLVILSLEAGAETGAEDLFVRPNADCPSFNGNGRAYTCAASNNGTGAWRGFPSVNGSATPGTDTDGVVDGGDTLYVCGSFVAADKDFGTLGASSSAMLDPGTAIAGSSGKRVTITGDCSGFGGSSRATINGGGIAGVDYGFRLTGAYVTLTKVDFQNIWAKSNPAVGLGTFSSEPADIFVQDVTITDAGLGDCTNCGGIEINSSGGSISSVSMGGIGNDAIYVGNGSTGATATTISDVTLLDVSATLVNGDGIQQEPGAGSISITDATIVLNALSTKACVIVGNATSAIVVDGVNCDSSASTGGGIVIDGAGTGSYVKNVYAKGSSSSGAGIYVRDDAAQVTISLPIYSNIVSGYTYGLLLDGAHSGTISVSNNTFSGASQYGAYATSSWNPGSASLIRNNVINASGHIVYIDSAVAAADWTSNYNAFGGAGDFYYRGTTYESLAAYVAGASQDANSTEADPAFLSGPSPTTALGFRPKSGSPLLGAGTYSDAKYDYNGVRFGNPPSIGAFSTTPDNKRSSYIERP